MSTTHVPYFKDDNRIIRIEINPQKSSASKFKYKVSQSDAQGEPLRTSTGAVQTMDVDLAGAVRAPTTKKTISACRLPNDRLNTGLDHLVPNPYKNHPDLTGEWEKVFKDKDKVYLQHLLEYENGVEFGYYTSDIPRPEGNRSRMSDKKLFFNTSTAFVHLNNNTTILYMNNPIHRVRYYMILAHNGVANSYKEMLENNTDWFIVDEDEREIVKQNSVQKEIFATGSLLKLSETKNGEAIIKMAKALNINEANDKSLDSGKAQRLVFEYFKQGEVEYENYKTLVELWSDKLRQPEFNAHAEIFDMIRYGIIIYKLGKYVVNIKSDDGGIVESKTFNAKQELIINFMLDPIHKESVDKLRQQLKSQLK